MATTYPEGPVAPGPGDWIPEDGVRHLHTLAGSTDAALAGKASTGYVDAGLYDVRGFADQRFVQAASNTTAVEAASIARDDALAADIAGMEGMTYVGAWAPGTTYRINDVVTHGGDSWARLTTGSSGEPGGSPTDWGLVARKGDGGGFGELSETAVTGLYETVEPEPSGPVSWADLTGKPATYPSTVADVDGLTAALGRIVVDRSAGERVLIDGVMVSGRTGSRQMRSEIDPVDGWTGGADIKLMRTGDVVSLSFTVDPRDEAGVGATTLFRLPDGFHPTRTILKNNYTYRGQAFRILSGMVQIYDPTTGNDFVDMTWATADPWPTVLPGTPA